MPGYLTCGFQPIVLGMKTPSIGIQMFKIGKLDLVFL